MNETATISVAGDPLTAILIAAAIAVVALLVLLVRRISPPAQQPSASRTTEQLASIETRLTEVERNAEKTKRTLHDMERTLAGLPTREAVHEIEKQVIALSGELKAMAHQATSTAAGVSRIEEFLFKASAEALFPTRNSDGTPPR